MFSSRRFTVLALTCRSLNHFELVLVWSICCIQLLLSHVNTQHNVKWKWWYLMCCVLILERKSSVFSLWGFQIWFSLHCNFLLFPVYWAFFYHKRVKCFSASGDMILCFCPLLWFYSHRLTTPCTSGISLLSHDVEVKPL